MKKLVTILFVLLTLCRGAGNIHAAYLRDVPVTVTQPDGTVLHCFALGDEFFNYLHDSNLLRYLHLHPYHLVRV